MRTTIATPPGGLDAGGVLIEPGRVGVLDGGWDSQAMEMDRGILDAMGDIANGYILAFVAAFVVTLLATPVMRWAALANGIVDRPTEARKAHRVPVAYLGGIAVFLGLIAAIAVSYIGPDLPLDLFTAHDNAVPEEQRLVPISVLGGLFVITFVGLWDDVRGMDPRLKIAGQLLASAWLALDNVGVRVADGIMRPIGALPLINNPDLTYSIPLPPVPGVPGSFELDLIYWAGTAIIAVFVLGACNASNLIDGLDGLLSGVTAIAAAAMLVIALLMAAHSEGDLDTARCVLAMGLLGACLGFLPHNFNPATIFLGDCGSLLLGYTTILLVLMLGDTGKTHLVVAGLIIYAIPIMDTVLAIVRRKLAGKKMSDPDDQHLHHMLKRALGVKGAVLSLYGMGLVFAIVGVWLTFGRLRVALTAALVFGSFIVVTAIKIARRQAIESRALLFQAAEQRELGENAAEEPAAAGPG